MNIPKAKDLVFKKIEDENAPDMYCCHCEKHRKGTELTAAQIEFSVGHIFMIVVCPDCEMKFKNHKAVNTYIRDNINRMRKHNRMQALKERR